MEERYTHHIALQKGVENEYYYNKRINKSADSGD